MDKQRVLANRDNIDLTAKDIEAIIAALPKIEVEVKVKAKTAQANFLERAKSMLMGKKEDK